MMACYFKYNPDFTPEGTESLFHSFSRNVTHPESAEEYIYRDKSQYHKIYFE